MIHQHLEEIMRTSNLMAVLILFAAAASAEPLQLQYVSSVELSDYVLPAGVLVYNTDNIEDLRIGDGQTPGGVRVQNSAALTNVQHEFHDDVHINGNATYLNDRCALEASDAVLRMSIDSNIMFSIYGAGSSALGDVMRSYYDAASTSVVLDVTISGYETPPEISYKAVITSAWETVTNAVYTWPPEEDPFPITIPLPADTSGYFRVYFPQVITGKVMSISALLNAPKIQTGELLISTSNAVINALHGSDYAPISVPIITNDHPGTTAVLKSDTGTYAYWEAE
jgi:hypothetical protein